MWTPKGPRVIGVLHRNPPADDSGSRPGAAAPSANVQLAPARGQGGRLLTLRPGAPGSPFSPALPGSPWRRKGRTMEGGLWWERRVERAGEPGARGHSLWDSKSSSQGSAPPLPLGSVTALPRGPMSWLRGSEALRSPGSPDHMHFCRTQRPRLPRAQRIPLITVHG